MSIMIYILRCMLMLLVTWAGVRLIGKKSIVEMTSYDFAAIMLLTTIAAEPLVFKIASKATVGVFSTIVGTLIIGNLSLRKFFYNLDSKPTIIIVEGKIIDKELKRTRMNVPLLLSELRNKGYQNVSDIKYAIIEPSGKLSVIAKSQVSPVTPKEMGIPTAPVNLSFPLIIDGIVDDNNLSFLNKDRKWLIDQLQAFEVGNFNEVILAQYDSSGQLFVNVKNKQLKIPNIF
ncbi:DUF421 domain-containing protein [Clostridium sp. D2Q-11]|uniref:DUF421 domain-containing protein n=1 Tax=Anaeromonas frigoriresistens TaxID=2683708 RepID=A0A942V406_9FIRM|nr:YetF domain-containing protein [Anaeromonas frigoriresistens]MBS4539507.1 DUF421 domain-containing protein [Anaeromonas frigoriresistens]